MWYTVGQNNFILRGKHNELLEAHPDCSTRQVPGTGPSARVKLSTPASGNQQNTGQSVRAQTVSTQPLDNMLRVVTPVQQIMTEFNGAVSEEDKIVVITKIVLNLMKQDGH
jgi:hypothetical protein